MRKAEENIRYDESIQIFEREVMLAELTDSRNEHDTEASEYGKLVSYSKKTKKADSYFTLLHTIQSAHN